LLFEFINLELSNLNEIKVGDFSPTNYFLGWVLGELLPLPGPDGFPVLLGPLGGGVFVFDIIQKFNY
jgi:hypothetical protein